jgi:hypothetical protein
MNAGLQEGRRISVDETSLTEERRDHRPRCRDRNDWSVPVHYSGNSNYVFNEVYGNCNYTHGGHGHLAQLFAQAPQKSPIATQFGVSVTAKINQDQAQQAKHENECYNSAKQQSGFIGPRQLRSTIQKTPEPKGFLFAVILCFVVGIFAALQSDGSEGLKLDNHIAYLR